MVEENIDPPPRRGRGRPKNGSPLENSLWRLEEIVRRAAVRHDRLPSVCEIADEMQMTTGAMAYHLLNLGVKQGLWRLIRPKLGFIEVVAMDGSWRTASYEEWLNTKTTPRKCLNCRREFSAESKYIFRCISCRINDDFDFTHI